jgi:hypothetical protein
MLPKHARYQAAPHPDLTKIFLIKGEKKRQVISRLAEYHLPESN